LADVAEIGLEKEIPKMSLGERAILIIPSYVRSNPGTLLVLMGFPSSQLAYGEKGYLGKIPADAKLVM